MASTVTLKRWQLVITVLAGVVGILALFVSGAWRIIEFVVERPQAAASTTKTRLESEEIQARMSVTRGDAQLEVQAVPGTGTTRGVIIDVLLNNHGANAFLIDPNDAVRIGRITGVTRAGPTVEGLHALPYRAIGMHNGRPQLMRLRAISITPGIMTLSYYTEVAQPGTYTITFTTALTAETKAAMERGLNRPILDDEVAGFGASRHVFIP